MTILTSSFILSFLVALKATNPLVMCLSLVMISIVFSALLMTALSHWLALALILIFLGGMMVIFFYATSLANNDLINFDISKLPHYILILTVAFFLSDSILLNTKALKMEFFSSLYSSLSSGVIYFLAGYLILSLIFTVKISANFEGALVKSF